MTITNIPKQQFILDQDLILGLNRAEVEATWKDMLEMGISVPPVPHFTIRLSGKAYVDLLNVALDRVYGEFEDLHDRVNKIREEHRATGKYGEVSRYDPLTDEEEARLEKLAQTIAQRLELRDKSVGYAGHADVLTDYLYDKTTNKVEVQARLGGPWGQVSIGQKEQFDNKELRNHRNAPAGAVFIGRGSKYGNPFVIGPDGTREEVIRKF